MSAQRRTAILPPLTRSFVMPRANGKSERSAPCPVCKTGYVTCFVESLYGRTLETCDNAQCSNAVSHPARPAPGVLDEPMRKGTQGKRGKRLGRPPMDPEDHTPGYARRKAKAAP